MRAALSLSLSIDVGQKASPPSLFESLFTGAPSLSTTPYILSKPAFPPVFTFSHMLGTVLRLGACEAGPCSSRGVGVVLWRGAIGGFRDLHKEVVQSKGLVQQRGYI
jgi:hypothetical protein